MGAGHSLIPPYMEGKCRRGSRLAKTIHFTITEREECMRSYGIYFWHLLCIAPWATMDKGGNYQGAKGQWRMDRAPKDSKG